VSALIKELDMETETLREARTRYFAANGFAADGGYSAAWVDFSLGPVPFPFPNTPGRVRAVRYHDLHHVLTGYPTSTLGELEISAWEIGAGCKGFVAAWALNLGGTFAGVIVCPRRTARAFARGLGDRSLYGEPYEPLLDRSVADARATFLRQTPPPLGIRGAGLLALTAVAGLVVGTLLLALTLPLLPFGLAASALRKVSSSHA